MTEAGSAPGEGEAVSWASETLPLALRRELLQRELKKLGLGKVEAESAGPSANDTSGAEQPVETHPQADAAAEQGS